MNTNKDLTHPTRHPERSEGSKLPAKFDHALGFFAPLRMTVRDCGLYFGPTG